MRNQENRPLISNARIDASMGKEEVFQNKVLRPIIKMQHELLIEIFKITLNSKCNNFFALSYENKVQHLNNFFSKEVVFRSQLIGIIIGHFSLEEYAEYSFQSSSINKRIMNIIKERIIYSLSEIK